MIRMVVNITSPDDCSVKRIIKSGYGRCGYSVNEIVGNYLY
jgi:hypothetical protein